MPNGQRMDITQEASGDAKVNPDDRNWQLGPGPERIDRQKFANNRGGIGPRGESSGFTAYPDDLKFMGHIPLVLDVPHARQAGFADPSYLSDDNANIPSPRAGDVLP